MTRVQIAVVVSGFPRRSETFAVNELLALEERRMLAGIFATKPGDPGPHQPGCGRLLPRLEVLPAFSPAEQGDALADRLASRDVQGVHAYFAHTPAEVAERAAQRLAVPFGFSVHAKDARKTPTATLARRARRAACVVACNGDVAEGLRHSGARTYLAPHGVNLQRFRPAAAPGGHALRLLAIGRLVEKKGFAVLIESLTQLDETFTLRILGEGPEYSRLTAQVAAAGLHARVTLSGARAHADLPQEYAAADVVVVPSVVDASGDRDGLPNVVLEAMASGRPVVGTRVGAIASAVKDGETGLLVEPSSSGALADALRRLADRPATRVSMGQRGRGLVEREFDLEQCTRRFTSLLETAYAFGIPS